MEFLSPKQAIISAYFAMALSSLYVIYGRILYERLHTTPKETSGESGLGSLSASLHFRPLAELRALTLPPLMSRPALFYNSDYLLAFSQVLALLNL
jgi:hypothetical protein